MGTTSRLLRISLTKMRSEYEKLEKSMSEVCDKIEETRKAMYSLVRQIIIEEHMIAGLNWAFEGWRDTELRLQCREPFNVKVIEKLLAITTVGGYHYGFYLDKGEHDVEFRSDDGDVSLTINANHNKWLIELGIKVDLTEVEAKLAEEEKSVAELREVINKIKNVRVS